MPSRSERTSPPTFIRDVLVNVVANLIAAAAIYLIGALVGLLPRNPTLIIGAVIGICSVGGMALIGTYERFKGKTSGTVFGVGFIGLGLATLALGIWAASGMPQEYAELVGGWGDRVFLMVGGLGELAVGLWGILTATDLSDRPEQARHDQASTASGDSPRAAALLPARRPRTTGEGQQTPRSRPPRP